MELEKLKQRIEPFIGQHYVHLATIKTTRDTTQRGSPCGVMTNPRYRAPSYLDEYEERLFTGTVKGFHYNSETDHLRLEPTLEFDGSRYKFQKTSEYISLIGDSSVRHEWIGSQPESYSGPQPVLGDESLYKYNILLPGNPHLS
jgi:hypothetical protein